MHDRVTIRPPRAIADAAGANISLIKYHFGGKDGLRTAVVQYLATEIGDAVRPTMRAADAAFVGRAIDPDQAGRLLKALVDRFVELMIAEPEHAAWAQFVLREQANPSPAFDLMYERGMGPVHQIACRIVGRLIDKPAESYETKLQAFSLIGQVLVFRAAHAAVLRRMGWHACGADEVEQIRRTAHASIELLVAEAKRREKTP